MCQSKSSSKRGQPVSILTNLLFCSSSSSSRTTSCASCDIVKVSLPAVLSRAAKKKGKLRGKIYSAGRHYREEMVLCLPFARPLARPVRSELPVCCCSVAVGARLQVPWDRPGCLGGCKRDAIVRKILTYSNKLSL